MAEAYAKYMAKLQSQLESKCGKVKTKQILAEARAHMDEGIEEMMGRGMSRPAAEEAAIARFGDTDSVCKWYAEQHQRPTVWRASRLPLVVIGASVIFWLFQDQIMPDEFLMRFGSLYEFLIRFRSLIVMSSLLALSILLCFRAKRFVSGVIAVSAAGLYGALILGYCLCSVPVKYDRAYGVIAKWGIADELKRVRTQAELDTRQLAVYREGQQVFAPKHEPPGGVGKFRDSRGYLSQIYFGQQDPRMHYILDGRPMSGIYSTYEEARNDWIDQPKRYCAATGRQEIFFVANLLDELAQFRRIEADLPVADSLSIREKLPAFEDDARFPALFFLGFGLIADIGGGVLRTLFEFIKRRRSPGPTIA
jgi:hypothetical protein